MSDQGWDRGSLDRHNALTPPDAERVAHYCNAMGEKNNTIHGKRLARAAMAVADCEIKDVRDRRTDLLDEVIGRLEAERDEALATIKRVRALLGDTAGPLWSVRGVREADIRDALEEQS